MNFLKEFFTFIIRRKKVVLLPLLLILLLISGMLVLTQGSIIAPFVYTLF